MPPSKGLEARLELLVGVPIYEFRPDAFLQQHGLSSTPSAPGSSTLPSDGRLASVERIAALGPGQTSIVLHCQLPAATRLQKAYTGGGGRSYTHHGEAHPTSSPAKVQRVDVTPTASLV